MFKLILRVFGIFGCIAGIGSYYVTKIDQQTWQETTFALIEEQSKLGMDIHLICAIFGVVCLVLSFFLGTKSSVQPRVISTIQENRHTKQTVVESPETNAPRNSLPLEQPSNSAFLTTEEQDIIYLAKSIPLAPEAKIVQNPFQNVPFGLELCRSTPETTRRSVEQFAEFLSKIPNPTRAHIKLVDVMATGIPMKNIVQGALNKYLMHTKYVLSAQIDGFDIRFVASNTPEPSGQEESIE